MREEVTVAETAPESPITPEKPKAVVQEAVLAEEGVKEADITARREEVAEDEPDEFVQEAVVRDRRSYRS